MSTLDSLYADLNRVKNEIENTKDRLRDARDRVLRESYRNELDGLYEYKRHIHERIQVIKEDLKRNKDRY